LRLGPDRRSGHTDGGPDIPSPRPELAGLGQLALNLAAADHGLAVDGLGSLQLGAVLAQQVEPHSLLLALASSCGHDPFPIYGNWNCLLGQHYLLGIIRFP
jgi:hypothetical protein